MSRVKEGHVTYTIVLPGDLIAWLKLASEKQFTSKATIIRQLIAKEMKAESGRESAVDAKDEE